MDYPVPSVPLAVGRGLRRRCPRCGVGGLFARWFTLHETCSVCTLRFEGPSGDTWGFWISIDRVFLFAALVALYYGFRPESWLVRGVFFAAIIGPLVGTMPHRQGAFVALDYLSREHWRS